MQFEADFVRYIGGGYRHQCQQLHGRPAPGLLLSGHRPGRRGDRAGADPRRDGARRRVRRRHAGVRRLRPRDRQHRPSTRSRRRITPRTRAICVVHYLGLPVDMDAINAHRRTRTACLVVEDCALAVGARFDGKHVGLLGDVGMLLVLSGQAHHHRRGRHGHHPARRDHRGESRGKSALRRRPDAWPSARFPASTTSPMLGLNYRMSEIAAALGRRAAQAHRRVPRQARQATAAALRAALAELDEVSRARRPAAATVEHSHYCLAAVLDDAHGAAPRRDRRAAERSRRRHQRLLPAAGAAHELLPRQVRLRRRRASPTRRASATVDRAAGRAPSSTRKTCATSRRRAQGSHHEEIRR